MLLVYKIQAVAEHKGKPLQNHLKVTHVPSYLWNLPELFHFYGTPIITQGLTHLNTYSTTKLYPQLLEHFLRAYEYMLAFVCTGRPVVMKVIVQ